MTSKNDIREWFDEGVASGASFMLVVCDTFDHDDYPSFVGGPKDYHGFGTAQKAISYFHAASMQNILEVYNLLMDRDTQIDERMAWHE